MRGALILSLILSAAAQPPAPLRDALEWTVAQRGRMAEMTKPVVRVHGIASLAAVVCAENPVDGSGLYRDAIMSLHNVGTTAFNEKGTTVLPAASFTGLWKYVVPAALKCDPFLVEVANNQRSKERIEAERRGANATLRHAWDLIDPNQILDKADNNDRAAQIANAAVDAAEPDTFDIALLTRFLSLLRDKAPDLADDLFQRGLDLVMSANVPDPAGLQELAKYLFTSPKLVDRPDEDQENESFTSNGATIEILTATRVSTNPDDIEALIDATVRLLDVPGAVDRNPQVAYALAYQLVPRARDLAPDKVDILEAAGALSQVQSRLGSAENPGQDSGSPAYRDYWLTGRIQNALGSGHIEEARAMLTSLNDSSTRSQLAELIKFREAALAIEAQSDLGIAMANLVRRGIKRSLLYIGSISSATRLDLALQVLPLATKDIQTLPAEHRVKLLSALTAGLVRIDTQTAISTMDLLVKAYNDVYVSPRRGRFDPRAARRVYSRDPGVDSNSDSSLILAGSRGFYEAVQTERGRHNFVLKAPGVTALSIGNFLAAAGSIEPARLEAVILGLRDENTRAGALVRLAEVRIKAAKAVKQ